MILDSSDGYGIQVQYSPPPKENKFLKMARRILATNPQRDATLDEALQEHFDAHKAYLTKQP